MSATKTKPGSRRLIHVPLYKVNPDYGFDIASDFNFLYVTMIELFVVAFLIAINFLGFAPTNDFYWSILLHLVHLFSWAGVYACLSHMFNRSYFEATMVLYVFNMIMDFAAFIWKLASTHSCTGITCDKNFNWGVIAYCFAGFLFFWDILVFVALGYLIKRILRNSSKQQATTKALLELIENDEAAMDEYDIVYVRYYTLLTEPPMPSNIFHRRIILVAVALLEPIFMAGLAFIMFLGLVINEAFMWSLFLGSLHFFSFMFLFACIQNNYSKNIFRITILLYSINLLADTAALVWRIVAIVTCDVTTNVDCVFRIFPGIIPIVLLSNAFVLLDWIVLFTMSLFYLWMLVYTWIPASDLTVRMADIRQKWLNRPAKPDDENDSIKTDGTLERASSSKHEIVDHTYKSALASTTDRLRPGWRTAAIKSNMET